jgi:hypothetical protein
MTRAETIQRPIFLQGYWDADINAKPRGYTHGGITFRGRAITNETLAKLSEETLDGLEEPDGYNIFPGELIRGLPEGTILDIDREVAVAPSEGIDIYPRAAYEQAELKSVSSEAFVIDGSAYLNERGLVIVLPTDVGKDLFRFGYGRKPGETKLAYSPFHFYNDRLAVGGVSRAIKIGDNGAAIETLERLNSLTVHARPAELWQEIKRVKAKTFLGRLNKLVYG